ncbi:MAG: patatin-like phospholipase family protein, partial [Burkholderiaceae bacterium]|nr:patatin-like phospholipase family protein [Burkholderiaceae bacterium]
MHIEKTRVARAVIAFAIAASAACATAQPTGGSAAVASEQTRRPKIGLVLSGGGARGAAHIGVLKVLEELRVPVDVIAGTSMGSIVGAAYATGMTVPEMEKAIGSITTEGLFTDRPPRQDQSMRRKDDDLRPYFVPELAVTADGVLLPRGLVTGVALEGELRKLVRVTSAPDFDQLPIPFRAIATDVGTGEMVVLKEGSVVQAIRASMSVPGAVVPVDIRGRQLVDGGLVRNLPVDIARSMGAEIIIAVNLGTPLLRPDQITSVLSVTVQMINILTEQNVSRSLAELTPRDILILPELGGYSAGDFDNLTKTVPIGEAAARKVVDRLRALSLPPEQYAAIRARQVAPETMRAMTIDAIKVEGTRGVSEAVVLEAMQTRIGQPLDTSTIDLDMRRIFGRGDFETVNYAVEEIDGKRTLVVLVKERPQRNYVRFGMELEAALGQQAGFNLL